MRKEAICILFCVVILLSVFTGCNTVITSSDVVSATKVSSIEESTPETEIASIVELITTPETMIA